ncbi:subtilase-type protease inhibitor [Streptomyces sp. NBC_01304]|uniref:subtilase-type protease inhibitor n=1 Tax=Streptomyces sp. NBC_01304 TaxID=2903818 RepID=UPI002E14D8B2|nr:subtilase-type protease inhibitor [Streptomyces sp. NBC_01304]
MRRIVKTIGTAATVAGCLLAASTATAQAQTPRPTGLYAPSDLVLAVGQGDDPATATVERAVTLTCAPRAGGTHPAAEAACAELTLAEGQFDDLAAPAPHALCTKEWNPVHLTADGVWQGRRVAWTTTFANPCEMRAALTDSAALSF